MDVISPYCMDISRGILWECPKYNELSLFQSDEKLLPPQPKKGFWEIYWIEFFHIVNLGSFNNPWKLILLRSLNGIKRESKKYLVVKSNNKTDENDKKLKENNLDFNGIKKINVPNNKPIKPFLEDVKNIPRIIKKIRIKLMTFLKSNFVFL